MFATTRGTARPATFLARSLVTALCLALVAGVAGAEPALAAAYRPRPLPQIPSVPGGTLPAGRPGPDPAARHALHGAPAAATLPAAGAATVDVPGGPSSAAPGRAGTNSVRAGGLPVWIGAADPAAAGASDKATAGAGSTATGIANGAGTRISVGLLGQAEAIKSRVRGVVLRVGRADGGSVPAAVSMTVDYSSFRNAFGGDWANRLRLVALPDCALSTPDSPACQGTPLSTSNDMAAGRASTVAAVPSSARLVALTAGASGSAGDFSATSLAPSATWHSGTAMGDFTWSYPMRTPPAAGKLGPQLALSYSSANVDGRTAASNNQPSWVGEGFDLWSGSIDRRYKACADDLGGTANNTVKTGDLCWATDNAVLSLGGRAVELIKDNGTGAWHPRLDDGSRVEHLTGAGNGANGGEYWRVTTVDGTQYWFGLGRLPGWSAGRPETASTWTVPVFGNNPGEPCHQTTFDASWCQQAWRWNLDYVVDPRGNSISMWYASETNNYGRAGDATKVSTYTRGGTLSRIDYGTRTDAEFGTPPLRVSFGVADRCIPGAACDSAHPASWPDVPFDQSCAGGSCGSVLAPTFWTTKRLSTVTTQVWGGSAYRDVDLWTLRHTYPDPGDSTRAGLWLAGITHTGLVGGSAATPELAFTGIQLNNRVDSTDFAPAMNWWRVAAITTETGGLIAIRYSDRDCAAGSRMPATPDSNTLRCFPVYWVPQGFTQPTLDWFHKYVVLAVSENDLTGGAPRVITTYDYVGAPAWHFDDDDGLVPPSRKSWAQWRGYQTVRVSRGDPGEQSVSESLYFRGMDGDRLASGTRSVRVTDAQGGAWPDSDPLAGTVREQITYNGPGGPVVNATVTDPYVSAPTATRTVNATTTSAVYLRTAVTRTRVALDGGRGFRYTKVVNGYDGLGLPTSTSDLGDESTAADDSCTRYSYARNDAAWLMSYQSRVEKYALACGQSPGSADDVISDNRTWYDGAAYGTPPTTGNATRTEVLADWSASAGPSYLTVGRTAYDATGRSTDTWDALNNHTGTAYTPAAGGPVTQTTTTNALEHTMTTVLEPAWSQPIATIDANAKHTDLAYDPLGRLTAVWLPGRVKGTDTPDLSYSYLIRANGAVAVGTSRLNAAGSPVTTYALYDSLLRQRQTQAPAPDGGRIITDTFYNTAAQAVRAFGAYYNASPPGTDLFTASDFTQVPEQTATAYDGAGRVVASVFAPGGQERWRTATAYGGDRVDVTPPAGGTATSTLTDARGRTVALRQYAGGTPVGSAGVTGYAFDRKGQLAKVTDPAGNAWTYGYDLRGRQVRVDDPDQGTSLATYDAADRVSTTTDARGQTLAYSYDALGRRAGVFLGSTAGTRVGAWVYDTLAIGQLSSATRYVGGNAYTVAVRGYTDRYKPTGSVVTVPAAEGALAGTYTFRTGYAPDDSLASTGFPAAGGLSAETVLYGYSADLGLPTTVGSPAVSYITETIYSKISQLLRYTMSTGGSKAWQTYLYENGTNRLWQSYVDRESIAPNTPAQLTYGYDPAGNVTKIADTPPNQPADTQCFGYDGVRRLTEAWTPASGDCAAVASVAGLGGPAPYWQSWSYDATGNRLTQTDHATPNATATTRYGYPAAGSAQPHTVRSATTTDSAGTRTATFGYDAAGDTSGRPGVNGQQALVWDAQRHLSSVTDGGTTTSFVYDADGNRLVRHDAGGATLYLPGTELRLSTSTGQVTATRYYLQANRPVAMRTPTGVSWLLTDPHGTVGIVMDATTQAVTQRRLAPFGGVRGDLPSWPDQKGFVGGTLDPTGLQHLGAREYDASIGRFLSVDPDVKQSDPQQLQGYAYADNTPVTASDPDGRRPVCGGPEEDCGWPARGAGSGSRTNPPELTPSPQPGHDGDRPRRFGRLADYTVDEVAVTEKVTTYTTVREVRYRPFYQLELVNRGGVLMLTLVMKKRPYFVERKVAKTVSATHVHGVARNSLDPTDVFEYDGVSYEIGGGDSDGPAVTYSRRSGWLLQPDAPSARQVHDFLGGVSVGVSVNYGTSTTSVSANVGWDSGSKAGVTVGPVGVEAGYVYPAAPGLSGSVSYTNANEIGTYRDPAG